MKTSIVRAAAIAVMLLLVISGHNPTSGQDTGPKVNPKLPEEPEKFEDLDQDEKNRIAFATSMEIAVRDGNRIVFENCFHKLALIKRIMRGVPKTAIYGEIAKPTLSAIRAQDFFFGAIRQRAGKFGSFCFLGWRDRPGQTPNALYRLISNEGAVNYYEFETQKTPKGLYYAVDCAIYLAGSKLSKILRFELLFTLQRKNLLKRVQLNNTEKTLLASTVQLRQIDRCLAESKFPQAWELFQSLPKELREQQRVVALKGVRIAANLYDEPVAAEAYATYNRHFKDDPTLRLQFLTRYFEEESWKSLRAACNLLEHRFNDPYLHGFRALSYVNEKDYDKARMHVKLGREAERNLRNQELINFWLISLTISLRSKDYSYTVDVLKKLWGLFRYSIPDLEQRPRFKNFIKSKEFKDWKEEVIRKNKERKKAREQKEQQKND